DDLAELEGFAIARREVVRLLRREEIVVVLADHLFALDAEQLFARAVEALEAKLTSLLDEDHERHLLDNRFEEPTVLAELLFIHAPRADVVQDHDRAELLGVAVTPRAPVDAEVASARHDAIVDVHRDVVRGLAAKRTDGGQLGRRKWRDHVRSEEPVDL